MRRHYIKIQSLRNQAWIADKCIVVVRFFDRLKGLIGKSALARGEGLFFPRCNDIHMWFMSIPIDVVFVRSNTNGAISGSRRFRVSSIHANVEPWKFLPLRDANASETLELPVGTIASADIQPGDELEVTDV